jgi:hypothetical protein
MVIESVFSPENLLRMLLLSTASPAGYPAGLVVL